MHRNIFHDKINTAYGNEKMSFRMASFEELNYLYFKLRNSWLNSELCAMRKLLHSDENAYVLLV